MQFTAPDTRCSSKEFLMVNKEFDALIASEKAYLRYLAAIRWLITVMAPPMRCVVLNPC